MNKSYLLTLALSLVAFGAQAKVADFNALINENVAAQKELHKEVQTQVGDTRTALKETSETSVVVEAKGSDINVPTNQKFLRFQKEIVDHQAPQKDLQKRLANEFNSVDSEF